MGAPRDPVLPTMTAPDTTRTRGHEGSESTDSDGGERRERHGLPAEDDRWLVESDVGRGDFSGPLAEGGIGVRDTSAGALAETVPVQRDGRVPLLVHVTTDDKESHLTAYMEMEPEQAEELAAMLREQAHAGRLARQEPADEIDAIDE